jgi:ABC-type transport system involved in multi-copper enzyme maturation permease subunit
MKASIGAELLVLRKRTSSAILLAIWVLLAIFFAYVLEYLEAPGDTVPPQLLPDSFGAHVLAGFPFFGGVFALMLGVLAVGGDYGLDTLKTLFTQGPGRLRIFGAKLLALAIGLVPFVIVVFVVGAGASYLIAQVEGAAVDWPSAWTVVRALGIGWLILATWAALGVLLGALTRGTALAIGVGILYTLVIEGLVSALASQVSLLEPLVELFVRANAYSLVAPLGLSVEEAMSDGPGAFAGPFVAGEQAVLVLISYMVGFLALSAILLRRRDVT